MSMRLLILWTNYNRTQLQKFYKRSYTVILSDLCNAIEKILDKIVRSVGTGFVYSYIKLIQSYLVTGSPGLARIQLCPRPP